MKNWLTLLVGFLCCLFGFGSVHSDTLYIVSDTTHYNDTVLYHTSFSESNSFVVKSALFRYNVGDSVMLTVINRDTVQHTFDSPHHGMSTNIPVNDTVDVQLGFHQAGTFRYFSSSPQGLWLGAAGVFQIGYTNTNSYIWSLSDMAVSFSTSIARQGNTSLPPSFTPDFCFINGYYYPQTVQDSDALVTGQVGDSIVISIVNQGLMAHALHFHGYHVLILDADKNDHMTGWSKDSFPVSPGESMTVLLVPHQPGIYPVHDHNLISVTNAGFYPGGMITQLNITP